MARQVSVSLKVECVAVDAARELAWRVSLRLLLDFLMEGDCNGSEPIGALQFVQDETGHDLYPRDPGGRRPGEVPSEVPEPGLVR
jgi:hypothetical protein